jgi:hypothetical protein
VRKEERRKDRLKGMRNEREEGRKKGERRGI